MSPDPESRLAPCADAQICESKLIHMPGAIQPHGALLAVRTDSLVVTHASANLMVILGCSPEAAIGQPLDAVVGEAAGRVLGSALSFSDAAIGQICSIQGPEGGLLQLHAHQSGKHICIDIERLVYAQDSQSFYGLRRAVLETFTHATGPVNLCELAVQGLKAITGYDRVMAYRFDDTGNGEVIAEVCDPGLPPYLGLHFPAEDVPPEARALFIQQPVGAIADTSYVPVPLLTDPLLDNAPLDLTLSSLRSVAPIHREYLRNMGAGACLTLSVVQGQETDNGSGMGSHRRTPRLWGMLVCHSVTPRVASPELRTVTGLIAQVMGLLLRSLAEAEMHAHRRARGATLQLLVDRLATPIGSADNVTTIEADLLRLVDATGALVRTGGSIFRFGQTPPSPAALRALTLMSAQASGPIQAVDDLGLRYSELASHAGESSGALLILLKQHGDDAILWFRPEHARTVSWGGNPDEHFTVDPTTGRLHPRSSFNAWKQLVRGRSAPWQQVDLAIAAEFRQSVEAAVAERTRAELARLRYYDPLTGLPNRSLLEDRLKEVGQTAPQNIALLFMDLDGFKTVNDTMGHNAGDVLLVEVANRILAAAPDQLVARLGGDEFVVFCSGLERGMAGALGESIRRTIEQPIEISGRPCHVTSSIGIALAGQTRGLDLVQAADMAMYAAKQAGGNRAVMFEPLLFERASRHFELEHELREALAERDQFVLLYQPIFAITKKVKKLAGFEALVRWRHPRHGWMSPAAFIPIAEKSGLIQPLGDWVLATGLRQGTALRAAYPEADLVININVSPAQLPRPGFSISVADAIEAEGFPPGALCLEVTESMLTDAAGCAVLADIRGFGVDIAIDDFGIGYSSLSYLRRLPVGKVKLDRSFLEDMEADALGAGFVNAVVALAHAAGKPVVFEGMETQAQVDIALGTGAEMVQGYFFAPPLSLNAAEELAARCRQLDTKSSARTEQC